MTLKELRDYATPVGEYREPTRIVTVRLSKSLHEGLKDLAHDEKISLNTLCLFSLKSTLASVNEEKRREAQKKAGIVKSDVAPAADLSAKDEEGIGIGSPDWFP